jgi:hypothetical protein
VAEAEVALTKAMTELSDLNKDLEQAKQALEIDRKEIAISHDEIFPDKLMYGYHKYLWKDLKEVPVSRIKEWLGRKNGLFKRFDFIKVAEWDAKKRGNKDEMDELWKMQTGVGGMIAFFNKLLDPDFTLRPMIENALQDPWLRTFRASAHLG